MKFVKMSIGKKLAVSFLILILLMAFVSSVTTTGMFGIRTQWERVDEIESLVASLTQREAEHLQWVMNLQEYLISGATQAISLEMDPTQCNLGKWLGSDEIGAFTEYVPFFEDELAKLYGPHNNLHASAHTIGELLRQGDRAGAEVVYYEQTVVSLSHTRGILAELRSALQAEAEQLNAGTDQLIGRVILFSLVVLGVAVLLSALIAAIVTRSITKPLGILQAAAQKIGIGDLGVQWEIRSRDEIGTLSESFRQMVDNLRRLIHGIQDTSESVNQLSQSLSSMAVETSASITEVASTSNEFSSTSATMADNSETMRTNTDHAVSELERGLDMLRVAVRDVASARGDVRNLTEAVDSLAERSKQIGAIVDLITQISDQTNLLALNAAIEAARAGESGRGFAVVADEVRTLAEQSRQASGDIADLVRQILQETNDTIERMNKADESVEKVDQQIDLTGNTFVAISKVFQEVAAQVDTIAKVADDVGRGSEQIAAATEEQSAIATILAGDSETLATLAHRLQDQIAAFTGF